MYLAKYELASRPIVQSRVWVEVRDVGRLADSLKHVVAVLPSSGAFACAVRVTLSRQHGLRLAWAFTALAEDEARLRRFTGAFARLESATEAQVGFPTEQEAFDALLRVGEASQMRVVFDAFQYASVHFPCDYRLSLDLEQLVSEAAVQRGTLTYQLHLAMGPIPTEMVRAVKLNALRLAALQGIPKTLVDAQERLASAAGGFEGLIEEFVYTSSDESEWLARRIAQLARRHVSAYSAADANVQAVQGYRGLLEAGLHQTLFEPAAPSGWASCGVTLDQGLSLLSWTPGPRVPEMLTAPPGPQEQGGTRSRPPPPPSGEVAFDFVSYARVDYSRVEPLVRRILAGGARLWWDHEIPGGSEWDEVIERHIDTCRILVLFLSNAAVASKYVRREVKYADAIGKRILAVELEGVRLEHGLAMLLQQYQRVPAWRPDLLDQIRALA